MRHKLGEAGRPGLIMTPFWDKGVTHLVRQPRGPRHKDAELVGPVAVCVEPLPAGSVCHRKPNRRPGASLQDTRSA